MQPISEFDSLLQACQNNDLEGVTSLIRGGANSYAQNSSGKSVIDIVAESMISEHLHGEPSEKKLNYALIINSMNGNVGKIKLLLALGADVNKSVNLNGYAPLHIACQEGHLEIAQVLISAGADSHAKNAMGKSPIDIVLERESRVLTGEKKTLNNALLVNSIDGNIEKVKLLLALGADVNYTAPSPSNFTALHFACIKKHLEIVEELINAKANLEAKNSDGYAPLHIACQQGHSGVVEKLIGNGAKINAETEDLNKFTPLHIACHEGHLEVVTKLIEARADHEAKTSTGHTPLHIACHNGHSKIVTQLIEARTDREAKNSTGHTPLHVACQEGHSEVVAILIEAGADREAKTSNNFTALHIACQNGHLEVVTKLIEARADLEAKTSTGHTPLHIACQNGHLEVVKILIEKGANPYARNSHGESAIDFATANEQIQDGEDRLKASLIINSKTGNAEKVKLLLALGGDLNQVDSSEFTLLHIASSKGHLEVVKALIEAGAEVSPQNQNLKFPVIHPSRTLNVSFAASLFGTEPLHLACKGGHLGVVNELIKAGAKQNKDHEGNYPLHLACQNGQLEVVKALIEAGAEIQNKDNNGNYPLDIAIKNRNSEITSFLTSSYMEMRIESPAVSPYIGVRIETPPMAEVEGQGGGRV